jgi:hypothetical protein
VASKVELTQTTPIVDPKTGLPTQTFLQMFNGSVRGLNQVGDALDGAIDGIADEASDSEIRSATGDDYVSAQRLETAAAAVALTDASTVAVDWDTGINFTLTMAGNHAIGNPTNGIPGTFRTIIVKGDDATDRTITFGNQFLGDVPTITDCDSGVWYALYIMCIATDHFAVSAKKVKG